MDTYVLTFWYVCIKASAYNNRAQVFRILDKDDEALLDIENAIELGTTGSSRNVLKQAYTQRAVIKKKQGDKYGADRDFAMGAQHGNEIAKGMVRQNPFAKLCNRIVSEAMLASISHK